MMSKDAKLYDLALECARRSPVDHRTLMRSAADFACSESHFALNSGLLALYWICAGRAYEATLGDVQNAYDLTIRAAEHAHGKEAAQAQIRQMLAGFPQERFVRGALARADGLWRDG